MLPYEPQKNLSTAPTVYAVAIGCRYKIVKTAHPKVSMIFRSIDKAYILPSMQDYGTNSKQPNLLYN